MTELSVMTLLNEALGLSKPKPKPKDKYATARAKAKRIAKKIGVEIEVSRIGGSIDYWVEPPKGIKLEHPFDRCGYYDWEEVLEVVEEYENMMKRKLTGSKK